MHTNTIDVPSDGLSIEDCETLRNRLDALQESQKLVLGYPCNLARIFPGSLKRLYELCINNVGDPFDEQVRFGQNTHAFEREVVLDVAKLLGTYSLELVWGYVAAGSTFGNIKALQIARRRHPHGRVLFSEQTHASTKQLFSTFGLEHRQISCLPNGSIDLDQFKRAVEESRPQPIIVFANVGTILSGAIDSIEDIQRILDLCGVEERYIHVDAALSGLILPFVTDAPAWDFRAGVDSIVVSGHKILGTRDPCGIFVTHKGQCTRNAKIDCVGGTLPDLACSRNGRVVVEAWYALRARGEESLERLVHTSLKMADYALQYMKERDINVWRNAHAITVVFSPPPSFGLAKRYQMAEEESSAHIVTAPHVTQETIHAFVQEYLNER